MKKIFLIFIIIFIIIAISLMVYMRLNSLNFFTMNIPKKIPLGFRRVSTVKWKPLTSDWLYEVKYENAKKQQIIYHEESFLPIECNNKLKKGLSVFKPNIASEGCSFYLENPNKRDSHWIFWIKNNQTYAILDEGSSLNMQEAMDMANSVGPEVVIVKDLMKKK